MPIIETEQSRIRSVCTTTSGHSKYERMLACLMPLDAIASKMRLMGVPHDKVQDNFPTGCWRRDCL